MKRTRGGAVLLEVVAALVILGTSGVALAALARATLLSTVHASDRDRELREANALMTAVTLWSTDDLDRRLGTRRQGRWLMRIDRPTESLYAVLLLDSLNHRVMETYLYRRERFEVRHEP